MLAYFAEELVWAIARERKEEIRKVRPHTERRTDADRTAPHEDHLRPPWRLSPLPRLRHQPLT
jgi:hypothetical protein